MAKDLGPRCPNHNVVLQSLTKAGKGKGIGICPISSCPFDYDEDYAEKNKKMRINAAGEPFWDYDWKVEGSE